MPEALIPLSWLIALSIIFLFVRWPHPDLHTKTIPLVADPEAIQLFTLANTYHAYDRQAIELLNDLWVIQVEKMGLDPGSASYAKAEQEYMDWAMGFLLIHDAALAVQGGAP